MINKKKKKDKIILGIIMIMALFYVTLIKPPEYVENKITDYCRAHPSYVSEVILIHFYIKLLLDDSIPTVYVSTGVEG